MAAKWETANPCEGQSGKQRSISRRQLLKSAGVSAAATGLAYLSLTDCWSSFVRAATTDMLTGQSPSAFTGETEDGVITEATAKPGQLDIVVKGRVGTNRPLPLLIVPRLSKSPTEKEQQQQRTAVERLLAASGSFVAPREIRLHDSRIGGIVSVRFLFLGEKDPARRINLAIAVKDGSGNILGKWAQECEDHRIFAEKDESAFGKYVMVDPANSEKFFVDRSVVQNAKSIELTFRKSEK